MRFGSWELGDEIGRGLHGVVHRARDVRDGTPAAVKVIRLPATMRTKEREELLARFRREVEITAALDHPGIASVRASGVEGRTLWLAMELADGLPLSEYAVTGKRLEPRRIARIVTAVADALKAVHDRGVVHRDVSPENVVLLADERVKLLDFGSARVSDSNLTATGEFLGSPRMISPEQIAGERPGPAADQFALAVTVFHLLSGDWPFPGRDANEVFQAVLAGEPVALSTFRPELPGAVARALGRALARDPDARFPDVTAFARAFDAAFAEETILPPRPPRDEESSLVLPQPIATIRARKARVAAGTSRRAAALLLVAILLGLAWAVHTRPWNDTERLARAAEVDRTLEELRSGRSCAMRRKAAGRLGDLGDPRAIPALEAAREDPRNRLCFLRGTIDRAIADLRR